MQYFLNAVIIFIVVKGVLLLIQKQKEEYSDTSIVRTHKAYIWIGALGALVFGGFSVVVAKYNAPTLATMGFVAFSLAGLWLIALAKNWRIELQDDTFIYQTFLKNRYEIKYSDIKELKITQNLIAMKIDGKKFFIEPKAIGIENFLDRCKEYKII